MMRSGSGEKAIPHLEACERMPRTLPPALTSCTQSPSLKQGHEAQDALGLPSQGLWGEFVRRVATQRLILKLTVRLAREWC